VSGSKVQESLGLASLTFGSELQDSRIPSFHHSIIPEFQSFRVSEFQNSRVSELQNFMDKIESGKVVLIC